MNCEQVEELLSAYLDNALAPEEIAGVTAHLQQCAQCRSVLADFRHNDALLRQLPRISPSPELYDKIFSSPEYDEIIDSLDANNRIINEHTRPTPTIRQEGVIKRSLRSAFQNSVPTGHTHRDTAGRPHLVAIPGGRSVSGRRRSSSSTPRRQFQTPSPSMKRAGEILRGQTQGHVPTNGMASWRQLWGMPVIRVAVAVFFLLAIGTAVLVGRNLWMQQASRANIIGSIPPPAGLEQGPFAVGMRFVFLRDGALWSTPIDGSTQPVRITPTTVTVAASWVVSPALPGRSAGDMLAYIDLQHAQVHTIRSDGQSDTIVPQPLLKAGVAPSSIWDTDTGAAILNGISWSKNGMMLAFVGDPNGTGLTNLYILSMDTGSVEMVPISSTGSVSHPTWSPDGIRLAFEFTSGSTVSVMDYNTQNHGLLTISDTVRTPANPADTVLTLDWSPNVDVSTITWSVGTIGHVHSIWIRRVGVGGAEIAQLLTSGDYVQAIYSRVGHVGVGSWLVVTATGDIWTVDANTDATNRGPTPLTTDKHVGLAWWSPNGAQVDYLGDISSGLGTLHVVNTTTGVDTLVASGVADEPAPVWSADSQELVYSTGTKTIIVNPGKKMLTLTLRGPAFAFIWSSRSSNQLVVATGDGHQGIYLVDVAHNTSQQLDTRGADGSMVWTEIP